MTTKLPFPTRAEAEELTRLAHVRNHAERKAKREEIECALSKRIDEFMVNLGDGIRTACSIGCNYHYAQCTFAAKLFDTYPEEKHGDLDRYIRNTINEKVFRANGFDEGLVTMPKHGSTVEIKMKWGDDSLGLK